MLLSKKLSLWLAAVTVMVALAAPVAVTATAGSTAAATISAAASVPPSASALSGTGGPSWVPTLASAAAVVFVVTGAAALTFALRRGAS